MAALALLLVLTGCTATGGRPGSEPSGCGPVGYGEVRGPTPAYAEPPLAAYPNDHAACAGVWLRTSGGFVPQGLVVRQGTAWVSGFDGDATPSERLCALERVDLATGRLLARVDPMVGQVGARDPVACRHGGGLVMDTHGLWLAEAGRLWLLDPATLAVRRVWGLVPPLRGSFAVRNDAGRLGIGTWRPSRSGRLFWVDPAALVASADLDVTAAATDGSRRVPRGTQGAVWGRFGQRRAGLWLVRSVSRCGVLLGPHGVGARGFVPGAEGLAGVGHGRAWVISESGSRYYQGLGDRPLVPTLMRLDLRDVRGWARPACTV